MKKLRLLLPIFVIFVLVLCGVSGKRWGSGSSNRGSSSGSRTSIWSSSKPKAPVSRPSAPISFHHNDKTSSSNFLHSESGRPSRPATSFSHPPPPVRSGSAPYPTGSASHTPSAPSHSTNTHSSGKPGLVHEQHQQSSASVAHSDPYSKQPAYNPHVSSNAPYVPSGGYGGSSHIPAAPHGVSVPMVNGAHSAPYPTLPNHPHPNNGLSSSSFPSHPPAYSSGPIHSQSSYSGLHNSPPPAYHPSGSYHPSNPYPSGGYHSPPPSYHAPPAYQPATAPFVPGRTVYVVDKSPSHSSSSSSGPGLGTYIGSAVAGGVAAGATNAIVDHAISSIFRPSPSHVHTYPSAPAVGTPTTVTNNYYYGNASPDQQPAGASNNAAPPPMAAGAAASQPAPQSGAAGQVVGQPAQVNPAYQAAPDAPVSNPTGDGKGNPSTATNGAVSRTPEGQPENPPPNNNEISDDDLMKFTEELFDKQEKNLNQYVELNLQKRVASTEQGKTVPDEAPQPLFNLKPELDTIPTVTALRALYDNYQRDGTQQENVTPERRSEENAFLDEVVKSPVMSRALDWLVEKKYVESDDYEKKDVLRRMWFNNFDGTSSGFERIFLSEKFGDSGIVGMQNWLYFANLESKNNVDYLGYVDHTSLSGKGSLLKLHYKTEGFTIQNATIFVGTAPELELALYTVCFYARPNNWCPISLGGAKFFILTHSFRYYGKDLIDLGFPAF